MALDAEPARNSFLRALAAIVLLAAPHAGRAANDCPLSVSPTEIRASAAGGSFSVTAPAAATCTLTAVPSEPWITATVTAETAAGGAAFDVAVRVSPNPGGIARAASLAVGRLTVAVTQDAAPCHAVVTPSRFDFGPAGGTGTVLVNLPAGCPLETRVDVPWIRLAPPSTDSSQSGGFIAFLVEENATPSARVGTLTIADATVKVSQQAGATCPPVPAPVLESPADGATGLPSSVSLSWSSSAGSAVHDVYLGTSPNPPLVAKAVTGSTWPATNLAPGRKWFWRVVARRENACANTPGGSSETRSFQTAPACAEPGEFDLLSPADGATGLGESIDLAWQAAAGAGTYDLFLGNSSALQRVAAGLSGTSFRATGLRPGAKYLWTVVARAACDPSRSRGTRTAAFSVSGGCTPPAAPVLTSPEDGVELAPGIGTFSWSAGAGAATWDLFLGLPGALGLYAEGLSEPSFEIPDLPPGDFGWRVVARSGCGTARAESAVRTFRVVSPCTPPPPPSFVAAPSAPLAAGQSYVLAWSEAPGSGGYLVERATDPAFGTLLDRQATAQANATFLPAATGTLYHRVRARSACGPFAPGSPSEALAVEVLDGAPNVVFTVPPAPLLVGLGESLEGRRVRFVVESLGPSPATVVMGQGRSTAEPFFQIVDPAGGDASVVTLQPRQPRAFDIVFRNVATDRAETYQGVVFCTAATSNLAVTPFAFVTLRVAVDGGSASADPEILLGGRPVSRIDLPPWASDDAARPPLSMTVRNPDSTPMELVEEIGPETWLTLERGWNATPLPPGASRTVKLSTRRETAPDGAGFPRYTYLGIRARGGGFARVLVVDRDVVEVGRGRVPLPGRNVRSRIVPAVVNGLSALGNTFVSRVDLTNAGTRPVPAELFFTPAGTDGFDPQAVRRAVVVVPPNDVVRLEDPLGGLFGIEEAAYGSLEVRTPGDRAGFLTVSSSVETPTEAGGSLGFAIPVLTRGEGARLGAPHAITGLVSTPSKRTNVLLVETTGVESTRVRLTLRDASGGALTAATADVPRYGLVQLAASSAALGAGDTLSVGSLLVEVLEGGGAVAAVATVIDGLNDDASAFVGRPLAGPSTVAPGEAPALLDLTVRSVVPSLVGGFPTFPGTGRTETFATRLVLTSLSSAPATFFLSYIDVENGETRSRTVEVPGRATVRFENAVVELFGVPPGTRTHGPAVVESTPNGLLACEVYSATPGGQLGDALPVIPVPGSALTGPENAVPLFTDGLEQSTVPGTGTRSNLLLNEVGGRPARVVVRLYEASNRTQPIAEKEVELSSLQKLQLSTVFRELGLDTEERRKDRTNVLVSVTAAPGTEGLVSAVVTRIDNQTGDMRNVLLTPSGGVAGAGGVTIGF